jgi:hypothetical protein
LRFRFRVYTALLLSLAAFVASPSALAVPKEKEALRAIAKMLPKQLDETIIANGTAQPTNDYKDFGASEKFAITDGARRLYRAQENGATFELTLTQARTSSAAYALLTSVAAQMRDSRAELEAIAGVGDYGFVSPRRVIFSRDNYFVRLEATNADEAFDTATLTRAAQSFDAGLLKQGASDEGVPVLVRHLPALESVRPQALYAVTLDGLQDAVKRQTVFEGYDFSGGTEAVIAPYTSGTNAPAQLVIIEHLTPQIAADNDRFVANRTNELRNSGAPVSYVYRRVGNYMVFVFGAASEAAANELIGGVKYEQDVRWLGDNPFAQQRAERAYAMMSLNVLLSSLKSAGLGVLLCLGVGTILGSIIFMRRRTQSEQSSAYSDAGGMVRLGIDNLTAHDDAIRMLPPAKK